MAQRDRDVHVALVVDSAGPAASACRPSLGPIPETPGRGYEARTDLIEKLTVRKETIRAMALVA